MTDYEAKVAIDKLSDDWSVAFERMDGELAVWVGDYEGGYVTLNKCRAIVAILEQVTP